MRLVVVAPFNPNNVSVMGGSFFNNINVDSYDDIFSKLLGPNNFNLDLIEWSRWNEHTLRFFLKVIVCASFGHTTRKNDESCCSQLHVY